MVILYPFLIVLNAQVKSPLNLLQKVDYSEPKGRRNELLGTKKLQLVLDDDRRCVNMAGPPDPVLM